MNGAALVTYDISLSKAARGLGIKTLEKKQ
jgi:hypothetical protein